MSNKILIFPSGAENALEVNEAIKHSVHVEVVPASSRDDYSKLIYEDEVRKLPFLNDPDFISELNALIEFEGIKLIFPTHDTAALFLTENQSEINCQIISSDFKTNEICRYKEKTYELFKNESFCPKLYTTNNIDEALFPVFAKPNVGQGSQGVKIINDLNDYKKYKANKDLLFVEYLPGKEYTIDCFTDRKGDLLFVGPRERAQIKMGISFQTFEVELTEEIQSIADTINEKLHLRGLWFFQLKEDKSGKMKLLEVSTRVAGTMGYFRHKGVNLPLFSVFDALGMDVEIKKQNFGVQLFRTTTNKYNYSFTYSHVYLDYDDTVIINNKVNKDVMAFIYQCKNNDIKIHLITKHGFQLNQHLQKFCIDPALFDQIISLKLEEKKSDYIFEKDAIFIDNWYLERKEVGDKHQIPCFDVDIVKSLIVK